jgi:hypothetical protein
VIDDRRRINADDDMQQPLPELASSLGSISKMKPFQGYQLIKPEELFWRPSNLMKIPNADFLERTGSENLAARLWRMPPRSASTLHKHIRRDFNRSEVWSGSGWSGSIETGL